MVRYRMLLEWAAVGGGVSVVRGNSPLISDWTTVCVYLHVCMGCRYNIAAAQGNEEARALRDHITQQMDSLAIMMAQRGAKNWLGLHKKPAASAPTSPGAAAPSPAAAAQGDGKGSAA